MKKRDRKSEVRHDIARIGRRLNTEGGIDDEDDGVHERR